MGRLARTAITTPTGEVGHLTFTSPPLNLGRDDALGVRTANTMGAWGGTFTHQAGGSVAMFSHDVFQFDTFRGTNITSPMNTTLWYFMGDNDIQNMTDTSTFDSAYVEIGAAGAMHDLALPGTYGMSVSGSRFVDNSTTLTDRVRCAAAAGVIERSPPMFLLSSAVFAACQVEFLMPAGPNVLIATWGSRGVSSSPPNAAFGGWGRTVWISGTIAEGTPIQVWTQPPSVTVGGVLVIATGCGGDAGNNFAGAHGGDAGSADETVFAAKPGGNAIGPGSVLIQGGGQGTQTAGGAGGAAPGGTAGTAGAFLGGASGGHGRGGLGYYQGGSGGRIGITRAGTGGGSTFVKTSDWTIERDAELREPLSAFDPANDDTTINRANLVVFSWGPGP